MKVSLIIPVYQAQLYLSKCLNSILNQTFTDFEVLLVDDGSSDGSEKICDEYKKKDKRIKVFHKQNQGVSSARNLGLDYAKGDYICFLDADDWIEADFLKKCVEGIGKADLLHHGFIRELWKDNRIIESKIRFNDFDDAIYTREQMAKILPKHFEQLGINIFGYLFKREMLKDIRFDCTIPYSEDFIFMMQVYRKINVFGFVKNNVGYHYNARMGSAAYKWQPKMKECYLKTFEAVSQCLDSFEIKNEDKNRLMANKVVNAYASFVYNLCLQTCTLTYKEKKSLAKSARKEFKYDSYKKYYLVNQKSLFEKVKTYLTFWHLEWILLRLGSLYVK